MLESCGLAAMSRIQTKVSLELGAEAEGHSKNPSQVQLNESLTFNPPKRDAAAPTPTPTAFKLAVQTKMSSKDTAELIAQGWGGER